MRVERVDIRKAHSVATHSANGTGEASLGDLVSRLTEQASELAQHEVRLARLEMQAKARTAARGGAMIAGGGLLAYAGVIALVFALVWALDIVLPLWAAALIAGIVVVAIGAGIVWTGLQQLRNDGVLPKKTIESMKENATWAKRQVA